MINCSGGSTDTPTSHWCFYVSCQFVAKKNTQKKPFILLLNSEHETRSAISVYSWDNSRLHFLIFKLDENTEMEPTAGETDHETLNRVWNLALLTYGEYYSMIGALDYDVNEFYCIRVWCWHILSNLQRQREGAQVQIIPKIFMWTIIMWHMKVETIKKTYPT